MALKCGRCGRRVFCSDAFHLDFPDVKPFSSQQSAVSQNTAHLRLLKTRLSCKFPFLSQTTQSAPFPLQRFPTNQHWWPLQKSQSPWKRPHTVARVRQVPEEGIFALSLKVTLPPFWYKNLKKQMKKKQNTTTGVNVQIKRRSWLF